jgi:hypothetical protein
LAPAGGSLVPYLLDERNGWAMNMSELKRAVDEAREEGKHVRGLVFINPGNPTGQCLSQDNLRELIKFAKKEHIVLMADEVYQENIYQVSLPLSRCRRQGGNGESRTKQRQQGSSQNTSRAFGADGTSTTVLQLQKGVKRWRVRISGQEENAKKGRIVRVGLQTNAPLCCTGCRAWM